jgi:hypothetical protein
MLHDDTPKGDRERSEFKIRRRKNIKIKRGAIAFPEHARSQVKGGHSSGEIELIQACDWLTADSTLDFQREFYSCKGLEFLVENLILFTLKSIENN